MQLRHGVKQVGDEVCATLYGSHRNRRGCQRVTNGERDASLVNQVEYAFCYPGYFGCCSDDANKRQVRVRVRDFMCRGHNIFWAVDFLEGVDVIGCGDEEGLKMGSLFGRLQERSLCVPAE